MCSHFNNNHQTHEDPTCQENQCLIDVAFLRATKISQVGRMDALKLDRLTSCISKGKKLRAYVREDKLLKNKSDRTRDEMEA